VPGRNSEPGVECWGGGVGAGAGARAVRAQRAGLPGGGVGGGVRSCACVCRLVRWCLGGVEVGRVSASGGWGRVRLWVAFAPAGVVSGGCGGVRGAPVWGWVGGSGNSGGVGA